MKIVHTLQKFCRVGTAPEIRDFFPASWKGANSIRTPRQRVSIVPTPPYESFVELAPMATDYESFAIAPPGRMIQIWMMAQLCSIRHRRTNLPTFCDLPVKARWRCVACRWCIALADGRKTHHGQIKAAHVPCCTIMGTAAPARTVRAGGQRMKGTPYG